MALGQSAPYMSLETKIMGGGGGHYSTALHQHTKPMTSQCYTHTTE